MHPTPANYDSIIFGATMLLADGMFYWANTGDWSPAAPNRDDATWIAAKKLSWRDASDWMGAELHYGASKPESDGA
ncbi:MAG TPA: hypothetical protein VK961_24560 [Chthoniobacter sp.]|nr:hypothetical protein [Chthoniobacter sp.]